MLLEHPTTLLAALLVALIADALLGEPVRLYRRVPHPVQVIGTLVSGLEGRLLRATARPSAKRRAGILLVLLTVAAAVVVGGGLALALRALPGGWVLEGLAMSTLLAQRSLVQHVAAVATGLRAGLEQGRAAVALIVGRDPERLDAAGVGRAAVELLAENLSDGVVAPLFWGLAGGLPGMLAYKTINTLDSMVGHRSERYLEFGWASARLDDLVNLPPARLTGFGLCLVGGRPRRAAAAIRRDAPGHRSPNAGWPEAAMAASLELRLAGPRSYGGAVVEDGWMGDGRAEVTPDDIDRAVALAWRLWWLMLALVVMALAGSRS